MVIPDEPRYHYLVKCDLPFSTTARCKYASWGCLLCSAFFSSNTGSLRLCHSLHIRPRSNQNISSNLVSLENLPWNSVWSLRPNPLSHCVRPLRMTRSILALPCSPDRLTPKLLCRRYGGSQDEAVGSILRRVRAGSCLGKCSRWYEGQRLRGHGKF